MPARIFSWVFSPKPASAATRPSLQAFSRPAMEVTPSSLAQGRDLLRAEARNLQHLDQPGLDRRLQVLEEFEAARGVQLGDLLRQRLADALHALDPALGDELLKLIVLEGLDRPGARRVGPDLERILALELHQRPDLGKHVGDLVLGHRAISDARAAEFNAGRRCAAFLCDIA
jgi:hypothetical protein